jgi:hypothetical protein
MIVNPLKALAFKMFGVPLNVSSDRPNLALAREWRRRLEERVAVLEATAEVWMR